MRTFLRIAFFSLVAVVVTGAALFYWLVYSPAPGVPRLSGTLTKGSIEGDARAPDMAATGAA